MTPLEEQKKAQWRKEQYEKILKEVTANEWLREYLQPFSPGYHDTFYKDYAMDKVRWLEWGPQCMERREKHELKWVNDAYTRLGEIQQKKLFDLQCQWRAGRIELPAEYVRITYDFMYWEHHILACPFLEPISDAEYEMYLQYLQTSNFEERQNLFESWQDYKEIKEAYQEDEAQRNFPDWYEFHNGRTGLSSMFLLPDLRGEMEEEYISLWREHQNKVVIPKREAMVKQGLHPDTGQPLDKRPHLNYYAKGWLTWFVETFEDKTTQEMFSKSGGELISDWKEHDVSEDLWLLKNAGTVEPIKGWFDWRQAIEDAAAAYRVKKIAEALPEAYEQYQLHLETGIGFEPPDLSKRREFQLMSFFEDIILEGRVLAGEPRDFNF